MQRQVPEEQVYVGEGLLFDDSNFKEDYGTPRHSGRYPWGSGENPYQSDENFQKRVADLKKRGFTEVEIAKSMGFKSTSQLRAKKDIHGENLIKQRNAYIFKLRDKGYSPAAISKQLQIPDSTVRSVLKKVDDVKKKGTRAVADELKKAISEKKYLDIGNGSEVAMGVSKDKLRHAVALLEEEGYQVTKHEQPQMGTGKVTTMKVISKSDTPWVEIDRARKNGEIDFPNFRFEHNSYENPHKLETPRSVDSKRIQVIYGDKGGTDKDGLIELRRGCEDLNLGRNSYAQVRIAVDGTHFIKGVAVYADDLPKGVDIRVNTNKPTGTPLKAPKGEEAVLKPMKNDPVTNNPFGASIIQDNEKLRYFQTHYTGKDGKEHLSCLNIVNEQGTWDEWNRTLSSQFLAKQTVPLAKRQLTLDARMRKDDFDEIMSISNPVIRKNLLDSYADNCDSAAVHLKAASLPRQATQLIVPFPDIKEDRIYAPNFRQGEKVVLVRFPHAGRFELAELTVDNSFKHGKQVIGGVDPTVKCDAVGIHPKVAEKLSGADFDGDTVLVIPNNDGKIKLHDALPELNGFAEELRVKYKRDPNSPHPQMTPHEKQMQMGIVSNLITDMTLKGAPASEIARAVKHSMVVIDAEKHDLDWRQSAEDNNIRQLYMKWQGKPRGGASTLISQAKGEYQIPDRRAGEYRTDPETGKVRVFYIDPKTGERLYTNTGKMTSRRILKDVIDPATGKPKIDPKTKQKIKEPVLDENGKVIWQKVPKMIKSQKMYEKKDALELSSGTRMETVYGEYANEMKALANRARLESSHIHPYKQNLSAKQTYLKEVKELDIALAQATANAPLERKAQALAGKLFSMMKQDNPELQYDKDKQKKVRGQCLEEARYRVGAKKHQIDITDRQWEAIQAGAISSSKLEEILKNTDIDKLKKRALPKTPKGISPGKLATARMRLNNGYSSSEVADSLGISVSTLYRALGKQESKS